MSKLKLMRYRVVGPRDLKPGLKLSIFIAVDYTVIVSCIGSAFMGLWVFNFENMAKIGQKLQNLKAKVDALSHGWT